MEDSEELREFKQLATWSEYKALQQSQTITTAVGMYDFQYGILTSMNKQKLIPIVAFRLYCDTGTVK